MLAVMIRVNCQLERLQKHLAVRFLGISLGVFDRVQVERPAHSGCYHSLDRQSWTIQAGACIYPSPFSDCGHSVCRCLKLSLNCEHFPNLKFLLSEYCITGTGKKIRYLLNPSNITPQKQMVFFCLSEGE